MLQSCKLRLQLPELLRLIIFEFRQLVRWHCWKVDLGCRRLEQLGLYVLRLELLELRQEVDVCSVETYLERSVSRIFTCSQIFFGNLGVNRIHPRKFCASLTPAPPATLGSGPPRGGLEVLRLELRQELRVVHQRLALLQHLPEV